MSENKRKTTRFALAVMMPLLSSCSTMDPKEGTAIDRMHETLEQGVTQARAQPVAPPPEVSAALLPPLALGPALAEQGEVEKRFDVSVTNASTREFLMGLVEGTSYNMVVHPAVQGTVSLSLKNVSISEVMRILRDVYGYEYEQTRDGFYVLPIRLQSRIFHVNYLNVVRRGQSQTRVSSGQVSDTGESGEGADTSDSSGQSVTSGSEISTRSEADFWTELRAALTTLVGTGEGRSVVMTPQTGLVIVRAMPAELREVENYLRSTHDALHRQVVLEAKILEVELGDGYQAGINWAKVMSSGDNKILLGQSGGGSLFENPDGIGIELPDGGVIDPITPSPVDFIDFKSFGGFFGAAISTGSFLAFIELLEAQGNVQVLSSPRIATLNNQKAVIKVGTDEFFVTDISTTTVTGAATTTTPDITLTPFFSGIALDVTPQIDVHGGVTLHIHPSVSEVTDQQKQIDVGDTNDPQTVRLPLAQSTVRESDSVIYAQSGQLVVIGGLMQEKTTEKIASTPWLGDLPVVGQAFRHTRQGSVKSELVILLRPIVVDTPKVWEQSLSGTATRLRALDRGFHYGSKPEVFGNRAETN